MSDSFKLLYVVNARIPNERAHGIQIVNTCEGLGKAGIDLTLVSPTFAGEKTPLTTHYGITQAFRHRKILALDVPGLPFRYFLRNFSFFASVILYILVAFVQSLFTQKRLVVYVRGEVILALIPLTYLLPIFFETHQIRNYERLYRLALERVRGIIVVTESLKQKFIAEYHIQADTILVARDSVDIEKFQTAKRNADIWSAYNIPPGKKIALYSGTLSDEKGVCTLAEAGNYVGENTHIVFLGGTEAQVMSFTERYGHLENISIIGRVNYTLVPQYVRSADVLILPDLAEYTYSNLYTSPMKLFEYMATGNPIVASRVPSLLEVLDETTAVFFEAGNAKSLGAAIQSLLGDSARAEQLGKCAQSAVTEFTWEKRAQAIKSHIQTRLG